MIAAMLMLSQSLAARPGDPNARDMYIACYQFLNDNALPPDMGSAPRFSSAICDIDAVPENMTQNGRPVRNRDIVCLPASARADERREMAIAYLDDYERIGHASWMFDGFLSFMVAMVNRWHCQSSSQAESPHSRE